MTKLKQLVEDYGLLALLIHYFIFMLVMAGFVTALKMGFTPGGTVENAGMFGAAYAFTKLSTFIRIPITLALTPIVARFMARFASTHRALDWMRNATKTLVGDDRAAPPPK